MKSNKIDFEVVLKGITATNKITIEEAKKRLVSNANFDMTIDNLLLKIWEEFNEKYSRC